jgi:hypothetical protein
LNLFGWNGIVNISTRYTKTPYYEYVKVNKKVIEFVWLEWYSKYVDSNYHKEYNERKIENIKHYKILRNQILENSN